MVVYYPVFQGLIMALQNEYTWMDHLLYLESSRGNLSEVEALLRRGANVNAIISDGWGRTALHEAARFGRVAVVGHLLQHGANIDATDKNVCTALHLAAEAGCLAEVEALLQRGANINATSKDGKTALEMAEYRDRVSVVSVLQRAAANKVAQVRSQSENKSPQDQVLRLQSENKSLQDQVQKQQQLTQEQYLQKSRHPGD
eukprot:TRINITY_DN2336_c0_g1_i5.p2 TRINITY_DN2336_c0_g1~~TRINITY_DN2336_c0_g1_i5.p2  ORF type:complete len:201 (+),score=46.77 TRINITY_DN2336_c0_g1_i5:43-645(+)